MSTEKKRARRLKQGGGFPGGPGLECAGRAKSPGESHTAQAEMQTGMFRRCDGLGGLIANRAYPQAGVRGFNRNAVVSQSPLGRVVRDGKGLSTGAQGFGEWSFSSIFSTLGWMIARQ